jgi:hypothetical protein
MSCPIIIPLQKIVRVPLPLLANPTNQNETGCVWNSCVSSMPTYFVIKGRHEVCRNFRRLSLCRRSSGHRAHPTEKRTQASYLHRRGNSETARSTWLESPVRAGPSRRSITGVRRDARYELGDDSVLKARGQILVGARNGPIGVAPELTSLRTTREGR